MVLSKIVVIFSKSQMAQCFPKALSFGKLSWELLVNH